MYVRKILATLKDAEDATARLQKLEMGSLTIGMVSTATYFLPHLLAEMKVLSPAAESFRYFVLERGEGRVSTSQQNIIHR